MTTRSATDRVVVVDDNTANLSLMGALLESAGFDDVILVEDPTRVVDLVRTVEPDVILLDLHMPVLTGFDLLPLLHEVMDPEDFVPIIVVTADSTTETRRRVLSAGASDLLIKPVDVVEVVQRTKNLLTTRHLTRELKMSNRALNQRLLRQEAVEREAEEERRRVTASIAELLSSSRLTSVFQPIVDIEQRQIIGVEALTRFDTEPRRSPDQWFGDAASVGMAFELEMAAIRSAIACQPALPPGAYLSVNCSPEVLIDPGLPSIAEEADACRIVLEMTEHRAISDYSAVQAALAELRALGFRVAVDDAGSGFASLNHILKLHPDVIKLDSGLIRDIDSDPAKRALATALVTFAGDLGASLIAEGVETAEEFETVRALGIRRVQGYLLGRPQPPPVTFTMPDQQSSE